MSKLNSILSGFNKTLRKLDALIEKNDTQANKHQDEIRALNDTIDKLDDETYQAAKVRDRIKDLIGE